MREVRVLNKKDLKIAFKKLLSSNSLGAIIIIYGLVQYLSYGAGNIYSWRHYCMKKRKEEKNGKTSGANPPFSV